MDSTVIIASIVVFLTITFVLVGMLLGAKAKLLRGNALKMFRLPESDAEA